MIKVSISNFFKSQTSRNTAGQCFHAVSWKSNGGYGGNGGMSVWICQLKTTVQVKEQQRLTLKSISKSIKIAFWTLSRGQKNTDFDQSVCTPVRFFLQQCKVTSPLGCPVNSVPPPPQRASCQPSLSGALTILGTPLRPSSHTQTQPFWLKPTTLQPSTSTSDSLKNTRERLWSGKGRVRPQQATRLWSR